MFCLTKLPIFSLEQRKCFVLLYCWESEHVQACSFDLFINDLHYDYDINLDWLFHEFSLLRNRAEPLYHSSLNQVKILLEL